MTISSHGATLPFYISGNSYVPVRYMHRLTKAILRKDT